MFAGAERGPRASHAPVQICGNTVWCQPRFLSIGAGLAMPEHHRDNLRAFRFRTLTCQRAVYGQWQRFAQAVVPQQFVTLPGDAKHDRQVVAPRATTSRR